MSDYTTITVRKEDKQVFEQTLDSLADTLGEEPTRSEAMRELAQSYLRTQAVRDGPRYTGGDDV